MENNKQMKEEGDAPGNVTANIDGYNTKYAFANDDENHTDKIEKVATQYGYSIVKKKKKKNFVKFESDFKKIATSLFLNENNSEKANK